MLPVIELFGYNIALYGFMILIGLFLGVSLAAIRGPKYNLKVEDIIYSSCYGVIGLVCGAKLLYLLTILPSIIQHWEHLSNNPSLFMPILSGGFVFYGGLFGSFLGYYIYCKQFHIDYIHLLDLLIPSIPLIHAFGRFGCFFAGCCYGIPYEGPLYIIFHRSISAPNHVALFPIQLLESGINLIAFLFLLFYARKPRKTGRILSIYLIYYAILRFFLEFFRGDIDRGSIMGLTTSQWISLIALPFGICIYIVPYIKNRRINNTVKIPE